MDNTDLFCHAMKEICIIFQTPTTSKPKYIKIILRQIYIIDMKAVNSILHNVYFTNAFINPKNASNLLWNTLTT